MYDILISQLSLHKEFSKLYLSLDPSPPDLYKYTPEQITVLLDDDNPNNPQPIKDNIVGISPLLKPSIL